MGLFDKIKNAVSSPKVESGERNKELAPKKVSGKSKNFKYLDELIHSGARVISLDSDIELGRREDSKYPYGIELDMDIVINGNNHMIDAKGKTRIFSCYRGNITLKNLTLKGGFNEGDGGAVYNRNAELAVIESTFIDNSANYGGGLYNDNGKVTVTNSTFKENRGEGQSAEGGAVYNSSDMSITDSTFSHNTGKSAGAIKVPIGTLSIVNSRFSNNRAEEYDGGALGTSNTFARKPCYVSIEKSTFEGNTAKSNGGAICDRGKDKKSKLDITETIFSNNGGNWKGGNIYVQGELNISDSKIVNNQSESDDEFYCAGNVKILNCDFSNNRSSGDIVVNTDSLQIQDTSFNNNQTNRILYNGGHDLGIFNCNFIGNDAERGIIYNINKNCTIEGSSFENSCLNIYNNGEINLLNLKIRDEGATIENNGHIYLKSSQDLRDKIEGSGKLETDESIIPEEDKKSDFSYLDELIHSGAKEIVLEEDICFEKYEKNYYEGGIEIGLDNLTIDGNGHTIDGADKSRIFIITGNNITLKNIIFKNGYAFKNYTNPTNNNGGAIKVNYNADLTIEDCEFISNSSEEYAGAIYNNGNLKILNTILTGNTSKRYGGGIYNRGELFISRSTLSFNRGLWKGGAIYDYGKEVNISESTLSSNSAKGIPPSGIGGECGFGGAIYSVCGKLIISKSKLSNNSTASNGGAIRMDSGFLTILESTLSENQVSDKHESGVINISNNLPHKNMRIGQTKIWNLETISKNNITFKDCIFEYNRPTNDIIEDIYY